MVWALLPLSANLANCVWTRATTCGWLTLGPPEFAGSPLRLLSLLLLEAHVAMLMALACRPSLKGHGALQWPPLALWLWLMPPAIAFASSPACPARPPTSAPLARPSCAPQAPTALSPPSHPRPAPLAPPLALEPLPAHLAPLAPLPPPVTLLPAPPALPSWAPSQALQPAPSWSQPVR